MKSDRRILAIQLRKQGKSIKAIATELNAAQSSVSVWLRDVSLTDEQKRELKNKTHSKEVIEKRRKSRLLNEATKRNKIFKDAYKEIAAISERELWLIGISLYWAEGGKTQRTVRFSNGDPNMIMLMIRFFNEICSVKIENMRVHIHIHESLDVNTAEEYWQNVTGINRSRFYKTYNKPNKSSKSTRRSLPHGVCDIYAGDYKLFLKIEAWTKAVYDQVNR